MTQAPFSKTLLIICLCLVCTACGSSFVARTVYRQLDNYFIDNINDYADFNKQQQQIIDRAAANFTQWHRETQLPAYITFLNKSADSLSQGSSLKRQTIENLVTEMSTMGDHFINAPWSLLAELYPTLTETQVVDIGNTLQRELEREILDYEKDHRSEKHMAKLDNKRQNKMIKRFSNFFDIDLSAEQKEALLNVSSNWIDLRPESFQLWHAWNTQAVSLLASTLPRASSDSAFIRQESSILIIDFLNEANNLERGNYPSESQTNKKNFISVLHAVLSSADQEQRLNIRQALLSHSALIQAL